MVTVDENLSFTGNAFRIRLPDCSRLGINRENNSDVTICQHDLIVNFFDVIVFLLSRLVTGPSFMSRSLLVQEL